MLRAAFVEVFGELFEADLRAVLDAVEVCPLEPPSDVVPRLRAVLGPQRCGAYLPSGGRFITCTGVAGHEPPHTPPVEALAGLWVEP